MPSGNVDKPVIEDNHDGTVSLHYDPREEGLHELALKFNGDHVQGRWNFGSRSTSQRQKANVSLKDIPLMC